jgi:long-chain fatty acid transport protein
MPKRFPALFLYLLLAALLIPVTANAAGFAIYEWGARGQALSGAMVGRADDPSALAYNPAGMTQLEGKHTMAGVTAIMRRRQRSRLSGRRSFQTQSPPKQRTTSISRRTPFLHGN